jgi:hypothetical protein
MVRDTVIESVTDRIGAVSKFTLRSTEPTTVIFAGDFNDGGRFRLWRVYTIRKSGIERLQTSGQYDE